MVSDVVLHDAGPRHQQPHSRVVKKKQVAVMVIIGSYTQTLKSPSQITVIILRHRYGLADIVE